MFFFAVSVSPRRKRGSRRISSRSCGSRSRARSSSPARNRRAIDRGRQAGPELDRVEPREGRSSSTRWLRSTTTRSGVARRRRGTAPCRPGRGPSRLSRLRDGRAPLGEQRGIDRQRLVELDLQLVLAARDDAGDLRGVCQCGTRRHPESRRRPPAASPPSVHRRLERRASRRQPTAACRRRSGRRGAASAEASWRRRRHSQLLAQPGHEVALRRRWPAASRRRWRRSRTSSLISRRRPARSRRPGWPAPRRGGRRRAPRSSASSSPGVGAESRGLVQVGVGLLVVAARGSRASPPAAAAREGSSVSPACRGRPAAASAIDRPVSSGPPRLPRDLGGQDAARPTRRARVGCLLEDSHRRRCSPSSALSRSPAIRCARASSSRASPSTPAVAFPLLVEEVSAVVAERMASSALNASSDDRASRSAYSTAFSGTSPWKKWWTSCGSTRSSRPACRVSSSSAQRRCSERRLRGDRPA